MGISHEDLQRVRGYLVSQAQKLSVPQLVQKMQVDSMPLRDAVAAVPPDQFDARPTADDWSAALICTHILEMTEHGARAVTGIVERGDVPASVSDMRPGFVREGLTRAEDFWPTFTARREPFYARVLQANGDEHLDVKITHPWFGPLNWREWLLFMRVHDLDHMRQLQTLAQHFAESNA
jgi:hypothetical protein